MEKKKDNEEAKVQIINDTTIVTQNCDPYSFYWQIDKWKSQNEELSILKPFKNYIVEKKNDRHNKENFHFKKVCLFNI